jgi:hypothetical protein
MRQVELAAWNAFCRALDNKPALNPVKPISIGDPQPIPKDGGPRIEIRVVLTHSAAEAIRA